LARLRQQKDMAEQHASRNGEKSRRDERAGSERRKILVISEAGKDELKDFDGQTGRHSIPLDS
jgi:hypothetical protein